MRVGLHLIIIQLGGLITPHDGQCYLEQRGNVIEYTMAETLVSQSETCHFFHNYYIYIGLSISWTHKFFTARI